MKNSKKRFFQNNTYALCIVHSKKEEEAIAQSNYVNVRLNRGRFYVPIFSKSLDSICRFPQRSNMLQVGVLLLGSRNNQRNLHRLQ